MALKQIFKPVLFFVTFFSSLLVSNIMLTRQAEALRDIVFPVLGKSSYINDYGFPRDGGARSHTGNDIIAGKRQLLVAVVDGVITDVQYPQPNWGYSVTIRDDDGYKYRYIHMNDDNPGTNDGNGGGMNAYAADVREGNRVARGQLIGRVGDSGRANGIPHLHFEIFLPNGNFSNPFQSLRHATRISKPAIPGRVTDEILPFGRYLKGGANIAMGNLDIDPQFETIIGGGAGNVPRLQFYQNEDLVENFYVYNSAFRGGIDVAAEDIDGDGIDEVITGAGKGGPPQVKVFNVSATKINDFPVFSETVKNGIKVTAGDVNGDGKDEIIIGAGSGRDPWVKVFNMATGSPVLLHKFLAYKSTFHGGVDVAAGNVIVGTIFDEIVTAAGPTGSPQVRIFRGSNGVALDDFRAYGASMKGGVRVSVGNVRTNTVAAEILTLPASKGNPLIKMVTGNGALISSRMFIEEWWIGGYDIAAGFDTSKGITGTNRRISARLGIE